MIKDDYDGQADTLMMVQHEFKKLKEKLEICMI